ncbi:MAG: hypothetical protein QOG76_7983 [Pseudonocardiales bacterium]|nr:hypothetical protein [Pseudonocardiales bacterium]
MGGDEKLRASPNMLIDQHQGRHTSLNRQGGFADLGVPGLMRLSRLHPGLGGHEDALGPSLTQPTTSDLTSTIVEVLALSRPTPGALEV